MRFKIITRDEAFDHLQRGDGEVCIVKTITDDTPIGALRNAEGFLLGIREEPTQEPKTEAQESKEEPNKESNNSNENAKNTASEPKPKAQPKKPRIDQGKVMALHRAGWNVSSIAMEVGCSGQSVRNIIEKHEGGEKQDETD